VQIIKNLILAVFVFLCQPSMAQDGGLTPEEQHFKDSIEALNLDFETISKAKEAYNQGIALFSEEKYRADVEAIAEK
jgi:hypothetical protein